MKIFKLFFISIVLSFTATVSAKKCEKKYYEARAQCDETQTKCIGLAGCIDRRQACPFNYKSKSSCVQLTQCMDSYEEKIDNETGRQRDSFYTACSYDWDQNQESCENTNPTYDKVTMFCPGQMKFIIEQDKKFNCGGLKVTLGKFMDKCTKLVNKFENDCPDYEKKLPSYYGKCKHMNIELGDPDAAFLPHQQVENSPRGLIKPINGSGDSGQNAAGLDGQNK
tara:strand:- start:81555 stop:82226 length:672 start_codon:yes stop_codon:yes gene_type:complete